MPNKDYTHITLVVDRSGSMASTAADAQGGLNDLIKKQAGLPGKCTITLVEFDNVYNVVYDAVDIKEVKEYALVPRGSTALLDAVGRGIASTGEALANMKEEDRPGLVIFAIVTDGGENSSKEYKNIQIAEMVKHQTEVYNWQFNFLGANQDAFANAANIGISAAGTANYAATPENTKGAYLAMNSKFGTMRCSFSSGQAVDNNWSEKERKSMTE